MRTGLICSGDREFSKKRVKRSVKSNVVGIGLNTVGIGLNGERVN